MFIMSLCCSKERKTVTDSSLLSDFDSTFKNLRKIMIEFMSEEVKMGLRDTQFLDLQEQLLLASTSKKTIPKGELQTLFKKIDNYAYLFKHYLSHSYFFSDNTRSSYSFSKVMIFVLLYSGGSELEKINCLYNLIEQTA